MKRKNFGRTVILDEGKTILVDYSIGGKPEKPSKNKERVFQYLVTIFENLPITIEGVLSEWVVFFFDRSVERALVDRAREAVIGCTHTLKNMGNFKAQTKIIEREDGYELWSRKVIGKPRFSHSFTIEQLKERAKNPRWWW